MGLAAVLQCYDTDWLVGGTSSSSLLSVMKHRLNSRWYWSVVCGISSCVVCGTPSSVVSPAVWYSVVVSPAMWYVVVPPAVYTAQGVSTKIL